MRVNPEVLECRVGEERLVRFLPSPRLDVRCAYALNEQGLQHTPLSTGLSVVPRRMGVYRVHLWLAQYPGSSEWRPDHAAHTNEIVEIRVYGQDGTALPRGHIIDL